MLANLPINLFFQPFFLIKIVFLVIIFIYLVFTFVVFNQVGTMNRVVTEIHSSTTLRVITFLNLLLAISLFFYVLVIL